MIEGAHGKSAMRTLLCLSEEIESVAWYEIAALLIGALGGLSGLAGFLTARNAATGINAAARKTDVDALSATITALQVENARLRSCLTTVETEQASQKHQLANQVHKVAVMERDNQRLRQRVLDLETENAKLKSMVLADKGG